MTCCDEFLAVKDFDNSCQQCVCNFAVSGWVIV